MPKTTIKPKKTTVTKKTVQKTKKYFEAVGRRKNSTARVRIWVDDSGEIIVNGKDYKKYFPTEDLATIANAPLRKIKMLEKFKVSVLTSGGGGGGETEGMRHGLARAF